MAVTVRIPVALRRQTGGLATVQALGDTVAEVLVDLRRQFPGLGDLLFDEDGSVKGFVNIYVDGDDIRYRNGLDTRVGDETEMMLLPAAAGGE